jgi:hypothetical protein
MEAREEMAAVASKCHPGIRIGSKKRMETIMK